MLASIRKRSSGKGGEEDGGTRTPGGAADDHQAAAAPSTPTNHNGSNGNGNGSSGSGSRSFVGAEPMTPSPVAASITAIPRDHAQGVDPEVRVYVCGVSDPWIGSIPLSYAPTHIRTYICTNPNHK